MIGVEISHDREADQPWPELRDKIVVECFNRGLVIQGAGESAVRFSPPLIVDREQVDFAVNMLDVPGFDGGEGKPWMGSALNNVTSFSKASKHSAETLLKIANWMAAPFGTEEYLFRKYGVAGRHYTLQGTDPVPTKVGVVETGIGLQYISDSQLALYWAGKPDVPQKQHAIQEKAASRLVYDASYGLYSDTQSKKQTQLTKTMTDLEGQIVQGRKPVSDWTAAVQTWKSSGGDKIRGELQDAFAAAAGGK